jgi:hypothetical protein
MYSKVILKFVFVFVTQVNSFRPFQSFHKHIKKTQPSFATSIRSFEEDLPDFMKKKQPIVLTGFNYSPPLCYHCKHYIHFTTLNNSNSNSNSTNTKIMEWYKNYSFRQDKLGTGFGLCKLFGNKLDLIRYSFAKHARENEDQCGRQGYLYEESYIGFDFNIVAKEKEEKEDVEEDKEDKEDKEKDKKEKSKDFIIVPYSTKEKEKEKDLEDLKNVNSQLYEYSIFLKKNENKNENK